MTQMSERQFFNSHESFLKLLLLALLSATSAIVCAQQPNATQERAFGIQIYPAAVLLEDHTRRLEAEKRPTQLTVGAYHTDADIKAVVRHFKSQVRKDSLPAEPNPVMKSLLRDNWEIEKMPFRGSINVFGVNNDLVKTIPRIEGQLAETSFGVLPVGGSLVRVHLLSPYLSGDSRQIIPGTLIILIRERLPPPDEPGQVAAVNKEMAYSSREVTRRARILSRPEPAYTDEASNKRIKGAVVIKAVFSSSGQVTNIRVIQGLPYGLTEAAVAAARKIKFAPAIRDGRHVSQHIQIEYHFHPQP